jgi:hypothetical protein
VEKSQAGKGVGGEGIQIGLRSSVLVLLYSLIGLSRFMKCFCVMVCTRNVVF